MSRFSSKYESVGSISMIMLPLYIIFFIIALPFRILHTILSMLSNAFLGLIPLGGYAPSPEAVFRMSPSVCYLSPADIKAQPELEALNQKVIEIVDRQLRSGRQLGVIVCAYHKGVEVVHVGGGVYRRCAQNGCGKSVLGGDVGTSATGGSCRGDPWEPVAPSTLFLLQSVTKGVCAAGIMALLDRGVLKADALVADYWPEFGRHHGKGKVGPPLTQEYSRGGQFKMTPQKSPSATPTTYFGRFLPFSMSLRWYPLDR
jgi:CubicO group peptidase (beta-lactamase class C family)